MDRAPRPPSSDAESPGNGDPYIGRTLGGTYRITARLGAGATGVVYLARHTLLDQDFAVKVLAPELANDPDVRRRLLLEARSLTLFTHKHAVQVRHCGEADGALYLAMDLCRGETLSALMEREGPISEERAARIVLQALEALGEAHDAGIVHRDLKPANMMIETTAGAGGAGGPPIDRVRILDFGLARIVGSEKAALPGALASLGGSVVGTVAYMSPEQLRAEEDVDGRSDLFSLGAVFYELVGGGLPFAAGSTMSIALRILEKEPPPLPDTGPHGVSAPLRAVISRALEKDRGRRFQTAAEFAVAVKSALGGIAPIPLPPRAPPPPTAERPASGPPSKRTLALLAAGLVVLTGGVWFAWGAYRESKNRADRGEAEAAAAEGRWNDAISAYGRLVAGGVATGEDFLSRARARDEVGDTNARSDLDEAERLLGQDPRVLTERGRFLWSVLRPPDPIQASNAFERALAASKGFAEARLERARMHTSLKNWIEAEGDLDAVARDAPKDPRPEWLRAEMATDQANDSYVESLTLGATEAVQAKARESGESMCAEAQKHAQAASDLDPAWAQGPDSLSRGQMLWARFARDGGHHDRSRQLSEAAIAAAAEAITRARKNPAHRAQGRSVRTYFARRAGAEAYIEDFERSAADWEQVLALAPNDPAALLGIAYAHMETGRYEDAIREYERLSAISTDPGHLQYWAFCYQRVGYDALITGDRKKAVEMFTKAIERYDRVAARSGGKDPLHSFLNYRAETYVMRAKVGGEATRQKDLDAAKADFDALSRPDGSIILADGHIDGESLHRRFDYWMEAGEPRKALEDIRAAIGDSKGKNASFYGRRARGALAVAQIEADAGHVDAARALLVEAREAADLRKAVVPATNSDALVLRGRSRLVEFEISGLSSGLDSAAAASREFGEALRTATEASQRAEAHIWWAQSHLDGGNPAAALAEAQEAVKIREEEHRAGRWSLSADYYRRLADALAANDRSDEVKAARARADEIEAEAKAPPR